MPGTELKLPPAAQAIVDKLGLEHSYEGLYLKRYYQSTQEQTGRPAATSIYGLAAHGAPSFLHRLDCDELWHFYAGQPLCIYLFTAAGLVVEKLGKKVVEGEKPLVVVPKGTIFGAAVQKQADWSFFGCTCIPGFELDKCEFIRQDSTELANFQAHRELIELLTNYAD